VHRVNHSVFTIRSGNGSGATWTPSAEEAYSKTVIQSAGYSGVSDLMRNPDGTWHGHAMKNDTRIDVAVDGIGRVTAN
jgi:hypothetical protein